MKHYFPFQASTQNLDSMASAVGLGVSSLSLKDLISDYKKSKTIKPKHVTTLVIWGVVYINKNNLNKANAEIKRRSVINQTSFH